MPIGRKYAYSLVALTFIVIFFFFIRFRTYTKDQLTKAFISDFTSLPLGRANFEDASKLRSRYGGHSWALSTGTPVCTPASCHLKFVFDNGLLSIIPGRGHIVLTGGITIDNNRVIARELEYEADSTTNMLFLYVVSENIADTMYGFQSQRLKVDANEVPHALQVRLGSLATAEQRSAAYKLDLTCLTALRGCVAPDDFYPNGWRQWR